MINQVIKEEIHPNIIPALMGNFRGAVDALLELVDNAADDWEGESQKHPIEVEIDIEKDRVWIDSRGDVGMGYDELAEFLKWGFSRKEGRIGQWGQGGKAAIGYLAKGLKLSCSKRDEDAGWSINEPQWDNRDSGLKHWEPQHYLEAKEKAYVKIELLHLKRNIAYEHLLKRLSDVYRPLLASGMLKIYIRKGKEKGLRVPPKEIPLKSGPKKFEFKLPDGKHLCGWYGIMASRLGKGALKGGMRCYHYGRLVIDGEFFGHPGPAYKASLNTLIGEVYIDFPVTPNLNKTDFDRESSQWTEINGRMNHVLLSLVKELLGEKEDEVSEEAKQQVKRAIDLVVRALKRLEETTKGELGESAGQKPPGKENPPVPLHGEDIIKPPRKERSDKGSTHEPATPPPEDAEGPRRRLGGVDHDVQPGDGRVRSYIDQTNGSRKVIVYTKYPGYLASKGDIVYLVETIALELAKPGRDEAQNLDEYWQKVNDTLALASRELLKEGRRKLNSVL